MVELEEQLVVRQLVLVDLFLQAVHELVRAMRLFLLEHELLLLQQ